MEWIIPAWGRILAGYTPALSIEITRECPLRCPGCYAYGDDHLGGDVTLREVRDFKGQELIDGVIGAGRHAQAAARVDRRRRAARALQGTGHAPAAALGARHSHAARHERRPRDSAGVGGHSAVVDRRLDRRAAAGARRAAHAGHLRSHPEAHRRSPDRRCTARSRGSRSTGRAISRSSCASGPPKQETRKIWISLYTPQIGEVSDERLTPADRQRVVADLMALRLRYPKLEAPEGLHRRLRQAAAVAGRVRLRADDDEHLRRSDDEDHAVPVRRDARLRQLRVRRVGGTRGASRATSCSGSSRSGALFTGSVRVGEQMRRLRPVRSLSGQLSAGLRSGS